MLRKLFLMSLMSVMLMVTFPVKDVFAASQSKLVDVSKQYLGVPYAFGGSTPHGFDCSGYTQHVFNKLGISIPRGSISQWNTGSSVSRSNLQVGDLVFFAGTYRSGISHVGIYIGNNNFISATSSRGIAIDPLSSSYWGPKYAGARRVADFSNGSSLFKDLNENNPAFNAVKSLTSQEIIKGYSDGTFRPDDNVTRHQAAAILNRYLGLEASESDGFADMKPGDRFYEDVMAMQEAGILNGYSDGTFKPGANMTRTEMAIIIERAFDLKDFEVSADDHVYNDVSTSSNFYNTVVLMNAIDQTGAFNQSGYQGGQSASRLDFTTAVFNGIQVTN